MGHKVNYNYTTRLTYDPSKSASTLAAPCKNSIVQEDSVVDRGFGDRKHTSKNLFSHHTWNIPSPSKTPN